MKSNLLKSRKINLKKYEMTLEERKFFKIFKHCKFDFSHPFYIFKVHKNHSESKCRLYSQKKNQVFAINKIKKSDKEPIQANLYSSLEELIISNNRVIENLSDFSINYDIMKNFELQIKTNTINLPIYINWKIVNLFVEFKYYEVQDRKIQLYKNFLNSFYSLQENRPKIFLTKQLKIKCNTSNNK